jgi:hypothetical protein
VNKRKIDEEMDCREEEIKGDLEKYAGIWAWDGGAILYCRR